jgi:hypothetical protein
MFAHRFTSGDWHSAQASLSDGDVGDFLRRWQSEGTKLAFGYFRSRPGGVMQTGLATVFRVTPDLLTLDTQGSRLAILLQGARFLYGNLGFLTPDNRGVYDIDGLSIFLSNSDWVFLFEDTGQIDVAELAQRFKSLPEAP